MVKTSVVLFVVLAFMSLGLIEKHERKAKPLMFGRCYIMHDNIVTCP